MRTASLNFKIVSALLILFISLPASACLNEYRFDKNGKETGWMGSAPVFYNDHDSFAAKKFLADFDLGRLMQYDFKDQSDIAVKLAYLGQYKKSLEILIRLQKQYPKEYSIAANLGTLYELNGNNEAALKFIRTGIALNPEAHEGSEWVHVKILEAKIAMKKDLSWLSHHQVIGTGIHFNSVRTNEEKRSKQIEDIVYQLKERIPFTPFPDPLIANVLNELGDLYAVEASAEMAYVSYDLSVQNGGDQLYGLNEKKEKLAAVLKENKTPVPDWHSHYISSYDNEYGTYVKDKVAEAVLNPELTQEKIGGFKSLIDTFTVKEKKTDYTLPIIGGIVLIAILLFFLFRRKKRRADHI